MSTRYSSVVVCVLCAGLAWVFWQYRSGFPYPVGQGIPVILILYGVYCGCQAFFARPIFSANYRGIQISTGAFTRNVVFISWSQFDCAERGTICLEIDSKGPKQEFVTNDALRINFKSAIDADTRYGYDFARFEMERTFVIDANCLGMSVEEAIVILNSLAKRNVV